MSTSYLHAEVTGAMVRLITKLWDDGLGLSHEGIARDLRNNLGLTMSVDLVRKICDDVSPVRIIDWPVKVARVDHDNFQFNGCEEGL